MALSRTTLTLLAIAAIAAAALCAWGIARRVAAFHDANPRQIFAFHREGDRRFGFAGQWVQIADEAAQDGRYINVHYGDTPLRLKATIAGNAKLPGLLPHEDWMRVLRFAPVKGRTAAQLAADLDQDSPERRLVIVTRTPLGEDTRRPAGTLKRNWVYDFYEFQRGGGFEHQRLRYPTTRGIKKPRDGELRENTWQFQAALQLMPEHGGVGPTHNFFGDALTAAGWLLPLAAFAGLAGTFALAFAFAPRRRPPDVSRASSP